MTHYDITGPVQGLKQNVSVAKFFVCIFYPSSSRQLSLIHLLAVFDIIVMSLAAMLYLWKLNLISIVVYFKIIQIILILD